MQSVFQDIKLVTTAVDFAGMKFDFFPQKDRLLETSSYYDLKRRAAIELDSLSVNRCRLFGRAENIILTTYSFKKSV